MDDARSAGLGKLWPWGRWIPGEGEGHSPLGGCSGCRGCPFSPSMFSPKPVSWVELHGSTCMENEGCGSRTSSPPRLHPCWGQLPALSQPHGGDGGGVSSSRMPGLSVSPPLSPCGVERAVNECKGQGKLTRFGEGWGDGSLGKHPSVCPRVCACARMGTHVAAPLMGTSALKPCAAGKRRGGGGGREQQRPGALITLVPGGSKLGCPLGTGVKPLKPCQGGSPAQRGGSPALGQG